jgi:pimeloyl-ACP methyl ester carboxylesterase
MKRVLRGVMVVGVLAALVLTAGPAAAVESGPTAGGPVTGRQSFAGEIDGAAYRVEVPYAWNGTLLLYSHGYFPVGLEPFGLFLTNRVETEAWLLDHGYALAASNFKEFSGYQIEQGMHDQLALLDWFEDNVGTPRRTISTGQSMGATIATLLAERHPDRFDGVGTFCGEYDTLGVFNAGLDVVFAVRTLLADDPTVPLVRLTDATRTLEVLQRGIERAMTTPEGRARLALIASFSNIPGWYQGHEPRPATRDEWIHEQALWILNAYTLGFGPGARPDLEAKAGGNPSWNVGVDYRRQLFRSSERDTVIEAYRAAGLDLSADLDRLAAAPRIDADPAAVAYLYRYGVAEGTTTVPMVTLHTTGDGGAVADGERWYAELMRRHGHGRDIRNLWVERGGHCTTSAAEEITALRALFTKIETGRWPHLEPSRLTEAAEALGPRYDIVMDFGNWDPETNMPYEAPMPPNFTTFTPPRPQRPGR